MAECLIQLAAQFIGEVFFHGLAEPFRHRKQVGPWVAAIGYACWGAAAGGLSLLLFPHLFARSASFRLANLVLIPLLSGAVMHAVGILRRRRHWNVLRFDGFAYGFLFALGMSLIRFWFGK